MGETVFKIEGTSMEFDSRFTGSRFRIRPDYNDRSMIDSRLPVAFGSDVEFDQPIVSNFNDWRNPPLIMTSNVMNPNLNADLLDGFHAADFVPVGVALMLDQTIPQTVINGIPVLDAGVRINNVINLDGNVGAAGEVLTSAGPGLVPTWAAIVIPPSVWTRDVVSNNVYPTTAGDGIYSTGATGTTPVSGAGTRFMWIPSKSALRAGTIAGGAPTYWDAANIGQDSVSFGNTNMASGAGSMAIGIFSRAVGAYSFAGGQSGAAGTTAGAWNFAFGLGATADQHCSVAFGFYTVASGYASFVANIYANATAYASTAFGRYNIATGFTAGTWVSTEPLFQIGNGTGTGVNSHDAFRLNKDGSGWFKKDNATNAVLRWDTNTQVVTIENILNIVPQAAAPGAPIEGDIYYNSTTHKLYCYDGTIWQACF